LASPIADTAFFSLFWPIPLHCTIAKQTGCIGINAWQSLLSHGTLANPGKDLNDFHFSAKPGKTEAAAASTNKPSDYATMSRTACPIRPCSPTSRRAV
jgi:hypothetical protein